MVFNCVVLNCRSEWYPACDIIFHNTQTDMVTPSKTQSTLTLDDHKTDGEYNPFDHRQVEHPTSTLGSFAHLLKSSLGTGLLATPAAFMQAGIVPGCIGTLLVAVIATHCVHILVATSREICKLCQVPSLSYTDTCEAVFKNGPKKIRQYSTFVRHFADYAMAGVCLGGTSVYVVFIAESIKDMCDDLIDYRIEVYCGMLLIPLILITQVRHLKFLVPFSAIANLSLLVTFGITCWYTFTPNDSTVETDLVGNVAQWPLFLGAAIFAMEGINVVMPIENEMAKPERFLGCAGVLNLTMGFVAVLYGVVGLLGYLKYGKHVQTPVTLNFKGVAGTVAKVLVVIAMFFTYCLQMYAPMGIIWTRIQSKISEKYHNLVQILQRTLCVTLTVILAVAIPYLLPLIGLVGAIFVSTLGLLIPIVIETVHKWERGLGKYSYVLWKNALLFIFYIVVFISGCYASISKLCCEI